MPKDQRPKIAADALSKVSLEPAETKDSSGGALNRGAMHNSINKQGVIAVPAHHVPKGDNSALNRGAMLNSINKQGVIAVPSEFAPKDDESLNRAATLTAISKQGVKSAKNGPKENVEALTRASMLNSIARQGVIAVPSEYAPDTSLSAAKLKVLQAAGELEKRENQQLSVELAAKGVEFQAAVAALGKDAQSVVVSAVLPSSEHLVVVASCDGKTGQDAALEAVLAYNNGKTVTLDSADSVTHTVPVLSKYGRVGAVITVTLPKTEKKAASIAEQVRALLP